MTGRDRLASNVVASWLGQAVYVAAGFLLPRLIDRNVGQTGLGIWDFSWSLVSYFGLAQVGIGASVNRYVAKYRAVGDSERLNRVVSSVMAIQFCAGLLVLAATATVVLALDGRLGAALGSDVTAAKWVVGFLGVSLAVQMSCDALGGVITGCHRWDVHNLLNSGFYGVSVVGMVATLTAGGGLRGIAAVYLGGVIATEVTRFFAAQRICPEFSPGWSLASWQDARTTLVFGGKGLIDGLAKLLLIQANNLLVAASLGPAALAQYARPSALVRHAENFVNRFAFVTGPTASSLQSAGRRDELSDFFIASTRSSTLIALPMLVFLAILGDHILLIWMGPHYQTHTVMIILACGYLLPLCQKATQNIMTGMNLHGRVGLFSICMAVAGIALSRFLLRNQGWGLEGAAVALAIAMTIGNGIVLPLYACRKLSVPVWQYVRRAFGLAFAINVPTAIALLLTRWIGGNHSVAIIGAGMLVALITLAPLYWRFALNDRTRERLRRVRLTRAQRLSAEASQ